MDLFGVEAGEFKRMDVQSKHLIDAAVEQAKSDPLVSKTGNRSHVYSRCSPIQRKSTCKMR